METSVHLRPGSSKDISAIRNIAEITWPVAYQDILNADQLRYMLDLFYNDSALEKQMNDGHHFLIAEQDQQIIGFASFNALNDTQFKLQKLYVHPEIQKTGAGKLLLESVKMHARNAGATTLLLHVNRHNKAIGFYEKIGFTIIRQEDIEIGHGFFMNDYVMELTL